MPLNLIGSIFSGAMNAISTERTNQMNQQIAREQMQWQQQENERAFNRDLQMWDMQNKFKSGATMGPPEANEYAVEPVGVEIIIPSER